MLDLVIGMTMADLCYGHRHVGSSNLPDDRRGG
jgi:hypothetical protein